MTDSPSIENEDKKPLEELSASTNTQDTVIAEDSSTSGESDSKEISTLDLVKQAIEETSEEKDETEGSSKKDDSKDEASKDDESKDEADEMTEEELSAMKHKTRKRFEQLQGKYKEEKDQRVALETKFTEISQKLEKTEVDAGQFRQFTNFLQTNNLNQEEANTAFDIAAWMKNDPIKALHALTPLYNQLLEVTGNVLPPDLQQQVEQGYITEDNALELSRQRAMNKTLAVQKHQTETVLQNTHHQHQVEQQQELSANIKSALAGLETSWKTSDPDYNLKSSRLHDSVKVMWYEASQRKAMPRSVEEAVEMVKKVKAKVDAEVRQFIPKKAVTPVNGGSPAQVISKPNSTLDVIKNALGQ